jgi:ribosomal-protein-alanine N-acetyltransferase
LKTGTAPEIFKTERLTLRRPARADAGAIFSGYASDPEVTRYLAFRRHQSLDDTYAFLEHSDEQWTRWPAGPYLIDDESGTLIGSTGLGFSSACRASTGYLLRRDAWGQGFATEALRAMVGLARDLGVRELRALCHPEHKASRHVLEKCGFAVIDTLERHLVFPNLRSDEPLDVVYYVATLNVSS